MIRIVGEVNKRNKYNLTEDKENERIKPII